MAYSRRLISRSRSRAASWRRRGAALRLTPWFISACAASITASTLGQAVALLALGHELLREGQVLQDGVGLRPLPEQVVVLEEVVVAHGGVRQTSACMVMEFSSMM